MRQIREREDLRPLLVRVKRLFPTLLKHVNLGRIFLCSFRASRSSYVARIFTNPRPWNLRLPRWDYAIEFWETRFDTSSLAYELYVLLHELFHIPVGGQDPKHRHYRHLRRHDLQEFAFLRRAYGLSLEKVDLILKGERGLFGVDKEKRYPRTLKIR